MNKLFLSKYQVSTPIDKIEKLKDIFKYETDFDIYNNLISTGKNTNICIGFNDNDDYDLRKNEFESFGSSFEERMMMADIKDYLHNDILVKVDRAAMSNSLETRIPFLDSRVAEFALSLLANSIPLIPGSIQSRIIRSGSASRINLSANSAFMARRGLKPD